MTTFYGSAASVRTRTGVKPDDLGLADDAALTAFLEETLTEVTDLMDRVMRKSYLAEVSIPAGLAGIANDACADALGTMVATRQTPVVRIDDFAVRTIRSNVLTPDIRERLKLYAAGRGVVSVDLDQDSIAPLPVIVSVTGDE